MSYDVNYRHLYYFWVLGKEGGVSRAAARLGMAVQTVGTQVRELERSLGHALLKPAGRGVALTEAGRAAMQLAEQIFELGGQLPATVRDAASTPGLRLAVGLIDGLPKLVIRHLMQPILREPALRLLCHEDEFDDLLGNLAVHKLDVVLSDRAAPANPSLKLYSHPLGSSALAWYAAPAQANALRRDFPRSLSQVPVLLPTTHVAVRMQLDQWFERQGVRPRVAGEFEDTALMKTFGAAGMGVFAAPALVHDELCAQYRVKRVAACEGVDEHFFLIVAERKIQHPLVKRLLGARRATR